MELSVDFNLGGLDSHFMAVREVRSEVRMPRYFKDSFKGIF